MKRVLCAALCCLAFLAYASVHAEASPSRTLDSVRAAGSLPCGVVVEQEDFNKTDSHGDLSAFSSAICRAVAASVLGSPDRARLVGFPDDPHGIAGLRQGSVALLVGTTPDATSAMLNHLRFSPTLFIDGQGFLVRRSLHARTPADLHGRVICYLSETPAASGLLAWRTRAGIAIISDPYEEAGEMEAALTTGHCDAITADLSTLANMRANFHGRRADFDILPARITFDPFAAATRDDDPAWTTIVSDVVTVLIEQPTDLLGPTPGLVSLLGLQNGWAARALAAGGGYGAILEATAGAGSSLKLPTGPNALWSKGGMIGAAAVP